MIRLAVIAAGAAALYGAVLAIIDALGVLDRIAYDWAGAE